MSRRDCPPRVMPAFLLPWQPGALNSISLNHMLKSDEFCVLEISCLLEWYELTDKTEFHQQSLSESSWLVALDCDASGQTSTPGRDRVKGCFFPFLPVKAFAKSSVLSRHHVHRKHYDQKALLSLWMARSQVHLSTKEGLTACGLEKHKQRIIHRQNEDCGYLIPMEENDGGWRHPEVTQRRVRIISTTGSSTKLIMMTTIMMSSASSRSLGLIGGAFIKVIKVFLYIPCSCFSR